MDIQRVDCGSTVQLYLLLTTIRTDIMTVAAMFQGSFLA